MGSVNITLANGQLGASLQTNDGIAGMVLTGVSESGGYTVGIPILVTNMQDVANAGITAANNPFAIKNLQEFYNQAGAGAQLYLMLTPATMNIDHMCDNDNPDGIVVLLNYAAGKIKILGVMSDDAAIVAAGGTITTVSGLNGAMGGARNNLQYTANAFFNAETPFRGIIGGTSYSGVAADPIDFSIAGDLNRAAILIGDTDITYTTKGAAIGLLLGTLSSLPVQRKISRVRNGALTNSAVYLGSAHIESVPGDSNILAQKGYITFTTYPNVSGYFFSGDPMTVANTDDYHFLSRGRVIDKAHVLAYTTFVQEVDDEVPVNADGTLDAGFCKWLERQITNQVNNTMTANKEISSVSCYIDPTQNILSTNTLNVVLKITPVGYATDIEISLGFENPAS